LAENFARTQILRMVKNAAPSRMPEIETGCF